eukprot:scaffold11998_cov174-Amphora_coffeaeformis.AAC.10
MARHQACVSDIHDTWWMEGWWISESQEQARHSHREKKTKGHLLSKAREREEGKRVHMVWYGR